MLTALRLLDQRDLGGVEGEEAVDDSVDLALGGAQGVPVAGFREASGALGEGGETGLVLGGRRAR